MQKLDRLRGWLELRDISYIALRLRALLQRYGITTGKARRRVLACVDQLASYHCTPSFPTPGRVVARHPAFFRELESRGVELAVHGYDHVDFRSLSPAQAREQFLRAADAFSQHGIRVDGFRCPYLSYAHEMAGSVPAGVFQYSSNESIWWQTTAGSQHDATAVLHALQRFYHAASAETTVAVPRIAGELVEIPALSPDDLQLHDGLQLGADGMGAAWVELLHRIHERGEVFVLVFHPELYYRCAAGFARLLTEAQSLQPAVWVTTLREVSRWWREKAACTATLTGSARAQCLRLTCSERASVLVRNIDTAGSSCAWHGAYRLLAGRTLEVPAGQRPFLGVSPDVPPRTLTFLHEQGYIIDRSELAPTCGVYLDAASLPDMADEVRLIDVIESSTAPLVRFWRWPRGARSALCITGDLDALSLVDYAARILN